MVLSYRLIAFNHARDQHRRVRARLLEGIHRAETEQSSENNCSVSAAILRQLLTEAFAGCVIADHGTVANMHLDMETNCKPSSASARRIRFTATSSYSRSLLKPQLPLQHCI